MYITVSFSQHYSKTWIQEVSFLLVLEQRNHQYLLHTRIQGPPMVTVKRLWAPLELLGAPELLGAHSQKIRKWQHYMT
jgi:hypothetical protein